MSQDEQALIPVNLSQLPSTQTGSDEGFEKLSEGTEFLARLQLFSKGTAINKKLIGPGRWGIPEGDEAITDLGESIDLLCLARRPKALDLSDKEAIITCYDMDAPEFERIANAAGQSDSGCMYGPSFLVIERSTGRFLEYFCGTKSTRSEAKKVYPYLPLTEQDIAARKLENIEPHGPMPFTMNIKLVERKRFSWHVPVVVKCSTPFTALPAMDKIVREIERFISPPTSDVEKVPEGEGGEKRAR
ncbi:MAG: hypothetical protein ACYSW8_29790 [Planctomycetota bacterium]|jgi:hypothetical protein